MCGIAGAVGLRGDAAPDAERVRRMTRLITHRGPDAEGQWCDAGARALLAHRRLSVIDLTTGAQPMVDESGRFALVFNGEIYNYVELRRELERQGVSFRSQSDTEVLLRLLMREGEACVRRLRGMFAFAFWDQGRGRLIMARDRVGKKPIFYTTAGGSLYFASTLRALRESIPGDWAIDPVAIDRYLTLGYIPAPATVYRGVQKLEAGTVLVADEAGVETRAYWDPAEASPSFDGSFESAVDRLDELLNTAVAIRLRSDVPLGVFLSGGIDSSLVAAVAAKQSATQLRTFSIGMDVAAFDESPYAAEVARRLGTAHELFRAEPDLLSLLPQLVWHYGEPYADSSALPSWLLAEQARRHVTVALGGDGGDEGFAGYDWYRTAARLRRIGRRLPVAAVAAAHRTAEVLMGGAFGGPRRLGQMRRGLAVLAARDDGARFAALRSFVSESEAQTLFAGELEEAHRADGASLVARHFGRSAGSSLRRMRYADIRTYLADCLLPKVDVATMAHGLELRAPLLDHEVIEFALSLPDEFVLDGRSNKRVLRAVLARYLPPELFERPKQGFSLPLRDWFRGGVRAAAEGLASSERLRATGWFRTDGIEALVREHSEGRRDHSQRLYSLLALDEWLKIA